MDDETSKTVEEVNSNHHAYLIEMAPGDPSSVLPPGSGMSEYLLAVPGKHEQDFEEDEASIAGSLITPRATLTPLHKATILPSDIQQISLNTRGYDENLEVTVVVKRKAPIIGYMLLLSSLFTIASVGVALDEVDDVVTPVIRIFWRNMATSMATFPMAMWILFRGERDPHAPKLRELVPFIVVAGVAYAFYLGSFVVALSMTSVGHATLFNNAHSTLIVFWKLAQRQPVAPLEALGAAIGVVGGGITTMDSTQTDPSIVSPTAAGDLVALSGAAGGAIYFTLAKKVRPHMHLLVFLCGLTATSATSLLVYMLATGEQLSLSTDPYNGVFGWLTPSVHRLLVVLYLVFICDGIGTMGYIGVMKYFDPIVVSVVCLMEPIVATGQGIVMGVDAMPGPFTFVGATLVIGGTFLVLHSQSRKTEKVDATEAVLASNATPRAVYSTRSLQDGAKEVGHAHSLEIPAGRKRFPGRCLRNRHHGTAACDALEALLSLQNSLRFDFRAEHFLCADSSVPLLCNPEQSHIPPTRARSARVRSRPPRLHPAASSVPASWCLRWSQQFVPREPGISPSSSPRAGPVESSATLSGRRVATPQPPHAYNPTATHPEANTRAHVPHVKPVNNRHLTTRSTEQQFSRQVRRLLADVVRLHHDEAATRRSSTNPKRHRPISSSQPLQHQRHTAVPPPQRTPPEPHCCRAAACRTPRRPGQPRPRLPRNWSRPPRSRNLQRAACHATVQWHTHRQPQRRQRPFPPRHTMHSCAPRLLQQHLEHALAALVVDL
ncbi:hypothetical protein ON010_g14825 [Phytophthora cinnamomi]|nr:hypothetical protein ON010_g14825 [Phytophthora cinnamomi]